MCTAASRPGSLVCVGLGMMLGAHLGPRARAHIEKADVVYVAASDSLVELWVQEMRPDARSLQSYYAEGKSRYTTYREMESELLREVHAGRNVCAAFYGHPGVFAQVPHRAIAQARADGFHAEMEPGVSAEDCLYADVGIDPGRFGCQHYEATQFLVYRRVIDTSAYLVLWQVSLVGDVSCTQYRSGHAQRRLLLERLMRDYPPDHEVVVYEAATLPFMTPRISRMPLSDLASAELHMHSTLVIPPCRSLERDDVIADRLTQHTDWPGDSSRTKLTLVK